MAERGEEQLETVLAYKFRRPELLRMALTHRSATAGAAGQVSTDDNERLEFLGDAVLGLLASEYLLEAYADWQEGHLSRCRARLVNAHALAAAARRLGLGEYLHLGRGEEKTGGRDRVAMLADAFEAVVGAMYLDGGIAPARQFLKRHVFDLAAEDGMLQLASSDHKSGLQEYLQAQGKPPAEYRVIAETGPDHRKTFLVEVWSEGHALAVGEGLSKKEAEQAAARQALDRFGETGDK
ncbi:MAG: ribonuclease III [Candidatus Acidiferrales bacterium]|jgi:ribonuclease-3